VFGRHLARSHLFGNPAQIVQARHLSDRFPRFDIRQHFFTEFAVSGVQGRFRGVDVTTGQSDPAFDAALCLAANQEHG
jgi:hypothetical protein